MLNILKILIIYLGLLWTGSSNYQVFAVNIKGECKGFITPVHCFRSINPKARNQVKLLMNKSFELFRKQKYLFSYAYAKKANSLAPQLRSSLGMMAISLAFHGNFQEALKHLQKIPSRYLNIDPFIHGYILFYNKRFTAAFKMLKSVPKTSPYYSLSLFYISISLIKSNFSKIGFKILRETKNLPQVLNTYKTTLLRKSNKFKHSKGIFPPVIDLPYLINFAGKGASDFLPKERNATNQKKAPKPLSKRTSTLVYDASFSGSNENENINKATLSEGRFSDVKTTQIEVSGSVQYLIPFYSNGLTLSLESSIKHERSEDSDDGIKFILDSKAASLIPKFSLGFEYITLQISQTAEKEVAVENKLKGNYSTIENLYSLSGGYSKFSYQISSERSDIKYEDSNFDSSITDSLDLSFQTDTLSSYLSISKSNDFLINSNGVSYSLRSIYSFEYLELMYEFSTERNSFETFEDDEMEQDDAHTVSLTYYLLNGNLTIETILKRELIYGFMIQSETEESYYDLTLDGIKDSASLEISYSFFDCFSITAYHSLAKNHWDNIEENEGKSGFDPRYVVTEESTTNINFSMDLSF